MMTPSERDAMSPEVTAAEQQFLALYKRVRRLDPELAQELDLAAGDLSRAYERMGFARARNGVTA